MLGPWLSARSFIASGIKNVSINVQRSKLHPKRRSYILQNSFLTPKTPPGCLIALITLQIMQIKSGSMLDRAPSCPSCLPSMLCHLIAHKMRESWHHSVDHANLNSRRCHPSVDQIVYKTLCQKGETAWASRAPRHSYGPCLACRAAHGSGLLLAWGRAGLVSKLSLFSAGFSPILGYFWSWIEILNPNRLGDFKINIKGVFAWDMYSKRELTAWALPRFSLFCGHDLVIWYGWVRWPLPTIWGFFCCPSIAFYIKLIPSPDAEHVEDRMGGLVLYKINCGIEEVDKLLGSVRFQYVIKSFRF